MILSASLSLAVKGHMGLRREEVIEYLVAPNRRHWYRLIKVGKSYGVRL